MYFLKKTTRFMIFIQIFLALMSSSMSVSSAIKSNNNEKYYAKSSQIQRNLPELSNSQSDSNQKSNDELIATGLTQSAQIINSDNSSDAAKELIESSAYGYVTQGVNDWLNQYGNSRIQINTDRTFSGELLLPIYDIDNNLFFSQSRIQRQNEDRTILNLGLGYRHFAKDMMWGINNFYDRDLKNNNARWGLGAEFGADYLKIATNGYFRLTDWRQSRLSDFKDYDERPANGFDIRAEGFLPSYPFLGANLKYEKYFGENVNLKGTNSLSDLKNDPQAYTAGISYTPVPLVSFKLSQTMGDVNETKGELSLEYRLGIPLKQQLDGEFVPQMRTLRGAKYDFVDRNNNIIMQYKKQNVLGINFTSTLYEVTSLQSSRPIKPTIQNKNNISYVVYQSNGGLFNGSNTYTTSKDDYALNFNAPAIKTTSKGDNSNDYTVIAYAVDVNGNRSNYAEFTVRVNAEVKSSKLYGINNNNPNSQVHDDEAKRWDLSAPDYKLYINVYNVVDEVGLSPEQTTGGPQGAKSTRFFPSTKDVTEIFVSWGRYSRLADKSGTGNDTRLTQIIFTYKDGTTKIFGGNGNEHIISTGSDTYIIPTGFKLKGVNVVAGGLYNENKKYVSQIGFIVDGPYDE